MCCHRSATPSAGKARNTRPSEAARPRLRSRSCRGRKARIAEKAAGNPAQPPRSRPSCHRRGPTPPPLTSHWPQAITKRSLGKERQGWAHRRPSRWWNVVGSATTSQHANTQRSRGAEKGKPCVIPHQPNTLWWLESIGIIGPPRRTPLHKILSLKSDQTGSGKSAKVNFPRNGSHLGPTPKAQKPAEPKNRACGSV